MLTSIMLAAALMRPPDGTYAIDLIVGGAKVVTSTVVIKTDGNRISAVEDASLPSQRVTAHTTTVYDAATLDEVSYSGDFSLPSGMQHTSVAISNGKATIDVGAQHVVLSADPAAPVLLTSDNMPGQMLWMPSIVQAHHAPELSMVALQGGRVIVEKAQIDTPGTLVMTAGDLPLQYTYDPKTGVVSKMDVPLQEAEYKLISQTASTLPVATPTPQPTALPLPPAHFSSKDVTFISADGTKLAGTVTIPDSHKGRYPAIVFVHGSGAENRDEQIGPNSVFLQLATALSNAGFVVLRYDKRGIGRSGGVANAMTYGELVQDVESAFRFIRTKPYVDPKRVFLLGHSEGGMIVPSVAVVDSGIAGVVLMAPPALPLAQVIMQQTLAEVPASKRAKTRSEEAALLANVRSGRNRGPAMALIRSEMDIDNAKTLSQVRIPVLILQGGSDVQVLPKNLPRLTAAAKQHNQNVTVRVFPGDNHLFMHALPGTAQSPQAALNQYLTVPGRIDPAVLKALIGWLRRV